MVVIPSTVTVHGFTRPPEADKPLAAPQATKVQCSAFRIQRSTQNAEPKTGNAKEYDLLFSHSAD